jgi:hypothetical protein
MKPYEKELAELFRLCEMGGTAQALRELLIEITKKIEGVSDIVKKSPKVLQEVNAKGLTPLMVAVLFGHTELVKEFMNQEAMLASHRLPLNLYATTPSGATVFDLVRGAKGGTYYRKQLMDILTAADARNKRLEANKMIGYHETSLESFNFILADIERNRYPMVGGEGGYFGGGIYFAKTTEESTRKSLHKGRGFECELKMGNCYVIRSRPELTKFYERFANKTVSPTNPNLTVYNHYGTPTDVMQLRMLEAGYDSVWGITDNNIEPDTDRILLTGDELVVYSADQVNIRKFYSIQPVSVYDNSSGINVISHLRFQWDEIFPTKDFSIRPSRKARYFRVRTTDKDLQSPFECTVAWMNAYVKKHYNDSLENGDILDYTDWEKLKTSKNPADLQVYFYNHMQTYSYMSSPRIKKEELIDYRQMDRNYIITSHAIRNIQKDTILLTLHKTDWTLFGIKTTEEVCLHYGDILMKEGLPFELLLHLTEEDQNLELLDIFVDYIYKEEKYDYFKHMMKVSMNSYLGNERLYFINKSKYAFSNPIYIPGIAAFLTKGSPTKEGLWNALKTIKKITYEEFNNLNRFATYFDFEFHTMVLYCDAYFQYNGKKYTFKDFFNSKLIKQITDFFDKITVLDESDNRIILTGLPLKINLFKMKFISTMNKTIPLYTNIYMPPSPGTDMYNGKIENASGDNHIYYKLICMVYKGGFDLNTKPLSLESNEVDVFTQPKIIAMFNFNKVFPLHSVKSFGVFGIDKKIKDILVKQPDLQDLTKDNYLKKLKAFENNAAVQREIDALVRYPITWAKPDLTEEEKMEADKKIHENLEALIKENPYNI